MRGPTSPRNKDISFLPPSDPVSPASSSPTPPPGLSLSLNPLSTTISRSVFSTWFKLLFGCDLFFIVFRYVVMTFLSLFVLFLFSFKKTKQIFKKIQLPISSPFFFHWKVFLSLGFFYHEAAVKPSYLQVIYLFFSLDISCLLQRSKTP